MSGEGLESPPRFPARFDKPESIVDLMTGLDDYFELDDYYMIVLYDPLAFEFVDLAFEFVDFNTDLHNNNDFF